MGAHKPYENATVGATRVFQSPDASSPVAVEVQAGTRVAAKPEPEGEWHHAVLATGEQGYVHKANLISVGRPSRLEELLPPGAAGKPGPVVTPFWMGFLGTVVPIGAVSIASAARASQGLWVVAGVMWMVWVLAGLVSLFLNGSVARGIFAGIVVSAVTLFVTCFPAFRDFTCCGFHGEATATPARITATPRATPAPIPTATPLATVPTPVVKQPGKRGGTLQLRTIQGTFTWDAFAATGTAMTISTIFLWEQVRLDRG